MEKENKSLRIDFILEMLKEKGKVNVQTVADHSHVTTMTVRRDLVMLERKGLLIRRYGGAVASGSADKFFSFSERLSLNKVAKKAISKKAAELILDNDTVFIDCGSTPFQIVQHLLGKKNLRIITNSLPVVSELLHDHNIRIIFLGGEVVNSRRATQGLLAERFAGEYRADKSFVGADGVSLANGLSAYNEMEGLLSRKMMEQSREVYLVCDASKLEKDSLYPFKPVSALTALITDNRAKPEIIARFRRRGISVITA